MSFYSWILWGKVEQSNIVITNGGSGYTTVPTISFSPSGASATAVIQNGILTGISVTSKGFYYGFDPPQITIISGGGNGASATVTKLSGGATGYANMPSTNISTNHHVVMLHCHESSDWIYGMTLAHELGHDLDLWHTYCGGGASAKICNNYCSNKRNYCIHKGNVDEFRPLDYIAHYDQEHNCLCSYHIGSDDAVERPWSIDCSIRAQ